MRVLRIPWGPWPWKGTTLVLVLVLAPLLAAMTVVDTYALSTATAVGSVMVGAATLAAAVFLYLHWRLTAGDASGWLSVLLCVVAVPDLALGAFSLTHADVVARQEVWLVVFRAAIMTLLVVAALASGRVRMLGDPFGLGLLVGLGVAVARQVVLVQVPPLPTPAHLDLTAGVVLGAGALALAACVAQLAGLPAWVATRCGVALCLLGLGSALGGILALLSGLAGAVLIAGTTAALLHHAIEHEKQEIVDLHDRLRRIELGFRENRVRLHEIDATVAGIASASRLIHDDMAPARRELLTDLVRTEVERLQRLTVEREPSRRLPVDLDDVIGQIVMAHRARGRTVSWEPSGHCALGRADDIAEVVNILLENAAVHGDPTDMAVDVTRGPERVEVSVSDHGPGVDVDVSEHMFDWGAHRPGSPGQGIGLYVAGDLAHDLGGELRFAPTGSGARFVFTLPIAPHEVGARDNVAHAQ